MLMTMFHLNSPLEVVFVGVVLFSCKFIIQKAMQITVFLCENSGADIFSESNLSDLEYAVGVVLLNEDLSKLQVFLDLQNGSIVMFGMHFLPSKYRMPLRSWIGSKVNFILAGEQLNEVDGFFTWSVVSYVVVVFQMKARLVLANLRHL